MEPSVITSCPGDGTLLMLLQLVVVLLQPLISPFLDDDDGVVSVFVFVLMFIVVEEAWMYRLRLPTAAAIDDSTVLLCIGESDR